MKNDTVDSLLEQALKSKELPPPALVSHVKSMSANRIPRVRRRLFTSLAAVALCLLLVVSAAAVVTDFFGARDLLLPAPGFIGMMEQPDGTVEEVRIDSLSLQGFPGSPEHDAVVAWQNFKLSTDGSRRVYIERDMDLDDLPEHLRDYEIIVKDDIPEEYAFYGIFTFEMLDKFHEILETYGLRTHGEIFSYFDGTRDNLDAFLAGIAKGPFLDNADGAITMYPGHRFESGCFSFDARYGDIWFQFHSHRKGVFGTAFMPVRNIDGFTEWSYQNAHGTELLLMKSADRAFILLDTETAFITVSMGFLVGIDHMDQSGLERFADRIDFRQLR